MANNELLKASIRNIIKVNGNQEITGDIMQQTLIAIVDALGKGYQYAGIATISTNPDTLDAKVFYFAFTNGVYPNFGGLSLNNEAAIFYYDTEWKKSTLDLVTSDALRSAIESIEPIVINGNVTNAPDEVDITMNAQNLLQFKNRSSLDGMGYVILRKNKTFAEQVTQDNTIYEIRYGFDLNGQTINMPKNCVLKFEGGIIKNGTLKGNNTCIEASSEQIFDISSSNLTITGTWSLPFGTLPEWFGAVAYKDANYKGEYVMASSFPAAIDKLPDSSDAINAALSLSSIAGCTCRLQGGQYVIKKTITIPDSGQLDLCANTIIIPIMQGSGLNADGEYSYAQNFDKYLPTSSYAIALSTSSCYTRITGGGRIALGKSKNTIGLYVRGKGYYYTDMIFAPTFDIKIIGGDSPNVYAANIDTIKGEIDPTSEVGVDGDTYLNTKSMMLWFKQKGAWQQTHNGNTCYNVCCRVEMVNPDERMANTRFRLWCINTYRGIEIICLAKNAWTNSITYEGNVSNSLDNYLSIFAGPWYADFSKMNFQIGSNMTKQCKIIYNYAGSFMEFGETWDLEYNERAKSQPRYYFGKITTYNKIHIWSDNKKYYTDLGTNNLWLAKEDFNKAFISIASWDARNYKDYLNGRRPTDIWTQRWAVKCPWVKWTTEKTDFGVIANTMYTKPNEGEGLLAQPAEFYNNKGFILLNKNRRTAVWAGVGSEANQVVVNIMSEPFYIIIDYAIMNEAGTKFLPETEATAEFYRQTASVQGRVPYETYPALNTKKVNGFFGTKYSQNRIVMTAPEGSRTYHSWIGCSLNINDETNNPVLKILKIQLMLPTRIWDYEASQLYPSTYGASAQRPACAVIGQSYFDETLKKNIWYDGTDWVDATGTKV